LFAVNILDLSGQQCSLIGRLDDGFYYSAFYSHLFLHEVPTKTGNIKHQCITLFLNINHKGPRPRSCSISPFPQSPDMSISCQLHRQDTSTEAVGARGMYLASPDQRIWVLSSRRPSFLFRALGSCRLSRHLSSRFFLGPCNYFSSCL